MNDCISVLRGQTKDNETYYEIPKNAPVQDWEHVKEKAHRVEKEGILSIEVWGKWAYSYKVYWKAKSELYSTYFVDERRDTSLSKAQKQLGKMGEFMKDTPLELHVGWGDMRHSWANLPFLGEPWLYDPKWVEDKGEEPIIARWYQYLLDLCEYAYELDNEAVRAHLKKAKDLELDELLTLSEEHANDYWKEQIALWESQYSYMYKRE